MESLTFDELRNANKQRTHDFINRAGNNTDFERWTPADWFQVLAGEVGEYANLATHYKRGDDMSEEEFKMRAADELADIQTYLDILAWKLNIDLGQATVNKFNRKSLETGSPVRL